MLIIDNFAGGGIEAALGFPKDCPPVAEAIVRTNCGFMAREYIKEAM